MQSPRLKDASQVCLHSCCPTPCLNLPQPQKTVSKPKSTSAVCRRDFAQTTAASIFPNSHFTNHESLPSLKEAFVEFTIAYPKYSETHQIDEIRAKEYYHLSQSSLARLDYIGIGLFSYAQLQEQYPLKNQVPSSSCPSPPLLPSPTRNLNFPFFGLSYKTGNLKALLLHGGQESQLESAMKSRIMEFLNISESDYSMVFTANRTSAFKLVAASYPFKTSRKLLSVYDYESEAVEAMVQNSEKRGAQAMAAEFSWPRLRIKSSKLRSMIVSKRKKKKKRGLFVFPLHSRVTGARYPYLWMNIAQENGWHVLIDACALGPKDMDCFGLSLLRPDFLICSFYKIFGENPSGFGCLFVKKSAISILEDSTGTGIVNIVPAKEQLQLSEESSGTDTDLEQTSKFALEEAGLNSPTSFSGPLSDQTSQPAKMEQGESSNFQNIEIAAESEEAESSGIGKLEIQVDSRQKEIAKNSRNGKWEIECRALDQVDSLGLILITSRSRYLINWLVNSLLKLEHPNAEGARLVRIYGPKIKFDRGAALAFNIYDWKGEKVEPVLVQKLADRSSISLSYGFLHHICFSDKYAEHKGRFLEKRGANGTGGNTKGKSDLGITVVTAALGFLANFEDTFRLWAFVAQFLDADFVEKERWRYTALNQKTIEV
ncbi:hypothetical protein UlMin_024356 [Ulmus minor]